MNATMNKLIAALLLGGIVTLPLPGQTAPAPDSTDLYYMVFLRPAAERQSLLKEEGERLQSAHMANIRSMAERGVLVAAGPFGDKTPSISGVFLFKTGSLEEARATAAQDPTVVEHRNSVEAFAWRGPKGIGDEYARLHKANPKTPEDMGVQPLFMLFRGASWDRQQSERAPVLRAHDGYVASLRRDRSSARPDPSKAMAISSRF